MKTIRLTAAQAMMRWLAAQMTPEGDRFIEGVWAIFGHGNVAGIGEALHGIGTRLPTWRGQNEQTMAHAAIAYAKTMKRRKAMAVTSSIDLGATNMVTAAALAHVNRLPVLLIPADVRQPSARPGAAADRGFRRWYGKRLRLFPPVSRYFDRIVGRSTSCGVAAGVRVMTDPANCGPVRWPSARCQAEAHDWPQSFFEPKVWRIRQPHPDPRELADLAEAIRAAKSPLLISGGGVIYADAEADFAAFAARHNIPYVETQAGKGANNWRDPLNFGSPGVTGSDCANTLCAKADLIVGLGTRFQDFTTGSWTAFANPARKLASVNLASHDASKHGATPIVGDAKVVPDLLGRALGSHRAPDPDFASGRWFKATAGRSCA
jgi:3D-(3,5/4)-trihydroxycyclohexane-1,2-dione acylhydrolase (decyclizing)